MLHNCKYLRPSGHESLNAFPFIFQIIYIGCSYATVYLIYMKFKATYDGNHDTFRVEFLVVPVGGLAFLVNHDFSPLEVRHSNTQPGLLYDKIKFMTILLNLEMTVIRHNYSKTPKKNR